MSIQMGRVIHVESQKSINNPLSSLREKITELNKEDPEKLVNFAENVFRGLLSQSTLNQAQKEMLGNALTVGLLGFCSPRSQENWIQHDSVKAFFEEFQRARAPTLLNGKRARAYSMAKFG